MDLRRLRTFISVVEQGTVSKASVQLHIAQPALSRQIHELEEELGVRLFDRVRRRLVLTGEGEQLLGHCRTVLGAVGSLGEQAQLLRRGDSGILRVAATPQTIEGVFSSFLHRYAQRRPNVQIRLSEAVGGNQLAKLERGEIHVAIGFKRAIETEGHAIESFELLPIDFLAACPKSLELGSGGDVDIARLASHPLLLLDSSFWVRPAASPASSPTSSSRAGRRMRCSRSPRPGTAWRSCPRYCRRTATGCGSFALPTGAGRCASRSPSSGTGAARFRPMPRIFANPSPHTCAKCFRSRGRRLGAARPRSAAPR